MNFLPCKTPTAWIQRALEEPEILLIDHAHCEKKAAATALNLMFRYVDDVDLLNKMSHLAREELRHFEKVLALMTKRGIQYQALSASRYAAKMRAGARTHEPARLVDILVIGAFIEARSCERFHALSPYLDEELRTFYLSLLASESRHFKDYLTLAEKTNGGAIDDRVAHFGAIEKEAIESGDDVFRFHSGTPVTS